MKKQFLLFFAFSILFTLSAYGQSLSSVYTNLKTEKCKTIEQSDKEAGWYRGHCKGFGGYILEVTEGDIRQSISVIAPNKKKHNLNFGSISSGFSSVGEKAEWRVKGKTPVALIVRFNASENPEDSSVNTSYLIVSKISKNQVCVVDVFKPSKSQNILARQSADSASTKSCKVFE